MEKNKRISLFLLDEWIINLYYLVYFLLLSLTVFFQIFKDYHKLYVSSIIFLILIYLFLYVCAFIFIKKLNSKNISKQFGVLIVHLICGIIYVFLINIVKAKILDCICLAFSFTFFNHIICQIFELIIDMKSLMKELIFRLILVFGIISFIVGIILGSIYKYYLAWIFVKISVGIYYILTLLSIFNVLFFRETSYFNDNVKKSLYYKFFIIFIYTVTIFTLPIYIRWCGLRDKPFEYFITLYSSVVGGILTLGGVAWTIKKSDKDRKEEERLKNKPIIILKKGECICNEEKENEISYNAWENTKNESLDTFNFLVKNITNSYCKLVLVEYNSKEIKFNEENIWIEGQKEAWINVQFDNFNDNTYFTLVTEDILGNRYSYIAKTLENGIDGNKIIDLKEEK